MVGEVEELIQKAQLGDDEAKNIMVQRNMGLVYSVARRFTNRGFEMEDLLAVGTEGLLKAILRFDLSLHLCFSTYALPMILGEIRKMFRDGGSLRVSRSLKEQGYRLRRKKEEIEKQKGGEATIQELAQALNISVENVVEGLEAMNAVISFSEIVYDNGKDCICVGDQICDQKQAEEKWVTKLALEAAMGQLSERERKVISLRYYQGRTQGEIARDIALSQAQVSRIEKGALRILKGYLAE